MSGTPTVDSRPWRPGAPPSSTRAEPGHRTTVIFNVAVQFALVFLAAVFYFVVRGLTESNEALAVDNAHALLRLESRLGIDIELRAQDWILDHDRLVTLANWVYIWGHWPVIGLTLYWLFRHRPQDYVVLRDAMFISGGIGLIIFMTVPMAPPRLLPDGFTDTVTELSNSYRLLQPPQLVNKYAAMPSLHFGWNLILGIVVMRAVHHPAARVFGVCGPVLMGLAVVLTGNHFVLDVGAGGAVALVGLAISIRLPRVGNRLYLDPDALPAGARGGTPPPDRPTRHLHRSLPAGQGDRAGEVSDAGEGMPSGQGSSDLRP